MVCSNSAIASVEGSAVGRNGGQLLGLTVFALKAIFLSETYCEHDFQAWELIEHECAHALSGDWRCENSPRFDAAANLIDTFYRAEIVSHLSDKMQDNKILEVKNS
jgi:hypothetical protein